MANEPAEFTVNEGEFLQWQDTNDVTGSVILSDKPIGLFGGNAFAGFRTATSVGHEYVLVPFETRRSSLFPEQTIHSTRRSRWAGAACRTACVPASRLAPKKTCVSATKSSSSGA